MPMYIRPAEEYPGTQTAWLRDLDMILPETPSGNMDHFLAKGFKNIPMCSRCTLLKKEECWTPISNAQITRCHNCIVANCGCNATPYSIYRVVWMLVRLVRGFGKPADKSASRRSQEFIFETPSGDMIVATLTNGEVRFHAV